MHGALHHGDEVGVELGRALTQRHVLPGRDAQEEFADGRRVEGQAAAQRLVHHHAEGVEIRARVHLATRGLLRRHVERRAEDCALAGQAIRRLGQRGRELRDPEVEDLHQRAVFAAGDQEDVLGLEIPMHDARGVGDLETVADLAGDPHDLVRLELAALLQQGDQRATMQELHQHIGASVLEHARVEGLGHVGRLQGGGDLGLAQQALHVARLRAVLGTHDLQRAHVPRAQMLHLVHGAHAAAADVTDHLQPVEEDLADAGIVRSHGATLPISGPRGKAGARPRWNSWSDPP